MPDKPYKLAVLRDRGKDLSKKWYIEYYVFSDKENALVRRTIQVPKSFQTVAAKQKFAATTIKQINNLLVKGYYLNECAPVSTSPETENKFLLESLGERLEALRPTLRPKSYITYRSALNKLAAYLLDDIEVNSVERKFGYLFRDYLLTSLGNSARTANNTLEFLRVLYNRLSERETVPDNPFQIKPLKTAATAKNIAFTNEHQALVEKYLMTLEPELYLFTRFMYSAFIRPGELIQLKGVHLNRAGRYILIPGEISKNAKTETVPVINSLYALLPDCPVPDEKYIFGFNLKAGNYRIGKQVPFRRHEKILDSLGLKEYGYTLYSWRHTGAVNAYLSGVGLKQLQALFRHSSVTITDNYLKSLGLRTDPNLNEYHW